MKEQKNNKGTAEKQVRPYAAAAPTACSVFEVGGGRGRESLWPLDDIGYRGLQEGNPHGKQPRWACLRSWHSLRICIGHRVIRSKWTSQIGCCRVSCRCSHPAACRLFCSCFKFLGCITKCMFVVCFFLSETMANTLSCTVSFMEKASGEFSLSALKDLQAQLRDNDGVVFVRGHP